MPLVYCTVNQLLVHLISFVGNVNYVTAQRTFDLLCQNMSVMSKSERHQLTYRYSEVTSQ